MERLPYRDRDYSFGQKMLTLRTAIGLTQADLAAMLGVSRRAVGDWEAGNKYPKAAHLKEFIAIGVARDAFPPGREEEEVRAFWRTAHQKVLLDEAWLGALLQPGQQQTQPGPPALTSMPIAQPEIAEQPDRMVSRPFSASAHPISPSPAIPDKPRLDWGSAPTVRAFYGRKWELQMASEWVVEERCRVVSVFGLAGIGKSALAVTLMHQIAEQFEVVIWRSLRDLPTSEALLDDLLETLTPGIAEARSGFEQRLSALLDRFRQMRVLLVLDNLGSVIAEGEGTGHMRPGYESFGRFLYRVAETEHQSCVLLTSREKPSDLISQEGRRSPVRALRLGRLNTGACEALLAEKGVKGTPAELARLTEAYAGNPLALSIVSLTIIDLFDGDLSLFLKQGATIYGGVRQLLDEQLSRLSELEQSLLTWLAIMSDPANLDQIRS